MKNSLLILSLLLFSSLLFSQKGSKEKYQRIEDSLKPLGSDKVIAFFEKENKLRPNNEEILRILGYHYYLLGKTESGEKHYRQAIKVNPACARCYMNIGLGYWNLRDMDQALLMFDKAVSLADTDAVLYGVRGKFKATTSDKFGAQMDLDKAIALQPKNPDHYIWRGEFLFGLNYYDLALADMKKAVSLAPGDYYPLYMKANALYEMGRMKEALTDINKAIQIDSTRATSFALKGAICGFLSDHTGAIDNYNRSLSLDPGDYSVLYNRALSRYAMEDMDGACEDLFSSHQKLKASGKQDPLLAALETGMKNTCDSAQAGYYYQRGIANFNLGNFRKAAGYYSEGLSKFPGNPLLYSFRGNAFMELKEYAQALSDYKKLNALPMDEMEKAVRMDTRFENAEKDSVLAYVNGLRASGYLSMAQALFCLGRYEEALAESGLSLKEAANVTLPNLEDYYNTRGNIQLALSNPEAAIKDFTKCIEINPRFALAYVNRAVARVSMRTNEKISITTFTASMSKGSFNGNYSFPVAAKVKKKDDMIILALEDCNRALETDPFLSYGFYMRGQIKKLMMQGDYCGDLLKASELGFSVEPALMNPCLK